MQQVLPLLELLKKKTIKRLKSFSYTNLFNSARKHDYKGLLQHEKGNELDDLLARKLLRSENNKKTVHHFIHNRKLRWI